MPLTITAELTVAQGAEATLILLCSDVAEGRRRPAFIDAIDAVSIDASVHVVHKFCSAPSKLSALIKSTGASRVIVACRNGAEIRDEVRAFSRRTGIHPSGLVILDMVPGDHADPGDVLAQSALLIRAAVARTSHGDLTAPVREVRALHSTSFSRRALFLPGNIARRPVAGWLESKCDASARCRSCVDSCPRDALSLDGREITVDPDRCSGCGMCVSHCKSDAISLGGSSIPSLAAVASVLASGAGGLAGEPGIAIVCEDANPGALIGGHWMPLSVPSLEMVSVGWLLQILASDVSVRLIGCDDERCVTRGHEVTRLCADLMEEVAPGRCSEYQPGIGDDSVVLGNEFVGSCPRNAHEGVDIEFHEPGATIGALSVLGSTDGSGGTTTLPMLTGVEKSFADRESWKVESDLSPLGVVTVEEVRCSACGCCALSCPTGALRVEDPEDSGFRLTLDLADCSACGACVISCPEGAITLRRVIDSSKIIHRRSAVVDVAKDVRCVSCGCSIAGGLAPKIIGGRLSASHPRLAERLRNGVTCADCLLTS